MTVLISLELVYLISLTLPEKEMLEEYAESSPLKTIRLRAHAVLMRDEGLEVNRVSKFSFRSERTVTRWLGDFSSKRMASIFSGHVDNENASKLTREQKQEIKETLSQSPNDQGLPAEFWNVPRLKEYLSAVFGVVYQSDHFLLRFSNLSFKYPDKLSPRRDGVMIEKRVKEIQEEISPLISDPNWVVFAADETRLQLEAEIRRAWLTKGKRTIIKTERSDEHHNYLGFLDQRYGTCQIFEIDRWNQVETIRVLKQLGKQYPNKRICVVWDNARWHKGKLLRFNLSKDKSLERLHLISFPPYAPTHNPIEHVWQYAKSKISNRHEYPFPEIKQDFLASITNRTFDYKI